MSKINDLKAEGYDLLAKMEAYQREIHSLNEQLQAKNKEISELVKAEAEKEQAQEASA